MGEGELKKRLDEKVLDEAKKDFPKEIKWDNEDGWTVYSYNYREVKAWFEKWFGDK